MNEIPTVLVHRARNGEQEYHLRAIAEGIRKDGAPTRFAVWWTSCRVCGAPFYVTSAISKAALARGPGIIRCPAHRQSLAPEAAAATEARLTARYGAPGIGGNPHGPASAAPQCAPSALLSRRTHGAETLRRHHVCAQRKVMAQMARHLTFRHGADTAHGAPAAAKAMQADSRSLCVR